MKKSVDVVKKQQFAPFPDPKGIPYDEYIKNRKDNETSKFEPFPDPNGVSCDEFEK